MAGSEHLSLEGASDRELLAAGRAAADAAVTTQRSLIDRLAHMWPTSAWRVQGCRSAVVWLNNCGFSGADARRLARTAELAARHPELHEAIASGDLSLTRADMLGRTATGDRQPFLADSIPALLELNERTHEDGDFDAALRFWAERVDEQVAPRDEPLHRLYLSQGLFGSCQIWGELTASSGATVAAALDAWIQDPDPEDAPHRRTIAERRADALDDLAHFALTHDPDAPVAEPAGADVAMANEGSKAPDRDPVDPPAGNRCRRTKRRSGVTVDVRIDLQTLAGRSVDDLVGLDLATDRWALAERSAERLLCDTALTATLFAGARQALDANARTERFTPAQRRALGIRDKHCQFPGCRRRPRHCDAHHVDPAGEGGPSCISNGVLLCRHHHRLIHEHGWSLTPDENGWSATDPHGTVWSNPP